MKQLAEALKITAELTVQEWNDFGLAVTRMVDVHVNRQEGEGGGEGDGEGVRGGKYIDNQLERETVRERVTPCVVVATMVDPSSVLLQRKWMRARLCKPPRHRDLYLYVVFNTMQVFI